MTEKLLFSSHLGVLKPKINEICLKSATYRV